MPSFSYQQPRLPYHQLGAKTLQSLIDYSTAVKAGSVGAQLCELMFLRVSQLNGCAACLDMHWRALVNAGEDARRLNSVATWQESPFFSPRERAALGWAEALSLPPYPRRDSHHDELFAALREHFSDQEIVELTMAIGSINAWNRISVGMRNPLPGA